ncbi:gap junction beta-3 protein [Paralichthys olivaceus]|uniref:gap junction beta-3 protein n=1 Tax=Paralichthys olivaceus TaxID=8255 RepID=UPI00097E0F93|nr:PREDICTED: gap junction beta-3 protein-like [Paralichthys olivaceus]
MAALVTGLIPILRTAVDATTTYTGRAVWFGFLCIRVVILFLAELPFHKLDLDFACNGTGESICIKACFNRHFHKPMMVAWNFMFVLTIFSVMLMELFTSHLRSRAQKRSCQVKADMELQGQGTEVAQVASKDTKGQIVIDLHRDRGTVGFYLFSITLRILIESWFLYVLLFWNLPALDNGPFNCSTDICSDLRVCVVRAAPEKRMSIYALASISGMIVVCSLLFCVYSIVHYLCHF